MLYGRHLGQGLGAPSSEQRCVKGRVEEEVGNYYSEESSCAGECVTSNSGERWVGVCSKYWSRQQKALCRCRYCAFVLGTKTQQFLEGKFFLYNVGVNLHFLVLPLKAEIGPKKYRC